MESVSTQSASFKRTCDELMENIPTDYSLPKPDVNTSIENESSTLGGKEHDKDITVLDQQGCNLNGHLDSERIQIDIENMSISEGKTLERNLDFAKKAVFQDEDLEDENALREESFEDRLPDGGWGWVVVCGAALILMLVDILSQCFGVIFSSFLLELETPAVVTSWIFNLFGFAWCASGPFLGPLTSEYGWRSITLAASLLLFIATVSSAFITAAWPLFFTYSLLSGLAGGIVSNVSYVTVPNYFNKRRGLANGILMAFDCSGQLLGPLLLEILQQEYTYKGANLILGGIILNCCIGAAVFHPVKWHLKPQALQKPKGKQNKLQTPQNSPVKHRNFKENQLKVFLRLIRSIVNDLAILKSARALTIALAATLIMNSYLNFIAFVPFAMQENGYTLKEVAMCVSISAMCNMITRIVVATFSDSRWFNYRVSMMTGSLIISGSMFCFTLFRNLTILKVIMGLWGCGVGMFMSIFNLVMVHYMGLDKLTQTLGATMLCMAIGYLVIGPLAGFVGDLTDGYEASMCLLASMVFISFLLWISMPAAVAYDKKKEEDSDGNSKQTLPDS